jgi:hypothetical protein
MHASSGTLSIEYLDIRKKACNILKELVTGHFAYMARDITPTNFEQTLRQLVVGHVQNTTQQANKLACEIMGCKEDPKYGFRVGVHPLLMNKDDIPAFLELQKAKFEELNALNVDTEWKMHPDRSMEIIMMCVGKYLKTEADTYMRMLNTQQQFTFEQLQAIVSTYEGSSFLTRTNSTAYRAAAMAARVLTRPEARTATSDSTRTRSRLARALEVDALMRGTNRNRYRRRSTRQPRWEYWRLAETTTRCSSANHTNTLATASTARVATSP